MSRRQAPPCGVRDWAVHPATHRTGFCDHHHLEYAAARGRWRSAVNNFRRGASLNDPGSWDEYRQRHLHFTDRDGAPKPEGEPPLAIPPQGPDPTPAPVPPQVPDSASDDAVELTPEARKQIASLASLLTDDLSAFQKRALNEDQEIFTGVWAARVLDRIEIMKCAAACLSALSNGEVPTGPWPRGMR